MVKRQLTTKQKIKKATLWLHQWVGMVTGIIVLVVALTGCIYVFEDECRAIFEKDFYYIKPTVSQKLPLQIIIESVTTKYPKEKIASIKYKNLATAAYIFTTKKDLQISVNPYTAAIVATKNNKKDFLSVVLRLHRTLLLGDVGKQIIKWNVLLFFLMCISGLILWWPKQIRFFKRATTINFKTKNWKAFNWDLHSVLGFYGLFILFIISLTGLFFVFDTTKNMVRFATGVPIEKREAKGKQKIKPVSEAVFNIGDTLTNFSNKYPGADEVFIAMPKDSAAPIRLILQYPYSLIRKQNILLLNQFNGSTIKEQLYINYNGYDKVAKANLNLHTGNIPALGIGSKIIFFLASLFAASLPITGFLIWLGRRNKVSIMKKADAKNI